MGNAGNVLGGDFQWFDVDDDHGVLELHERLTSGIGLELHLAFVPR